MKEEQEIEIDLLEIFYYLRSKLIWLILIFVIGGIAVGSFTYFFITPKYTATAKIYMVSASSESVLNLSDLNLGTSLSQDYEELIQLRPVFNEVKENLSLPYEYEDMLEMVNIQKMGDTRILAVSATSEVPAEAQAIANELADVAVTYIPQVMETSTPNIAEYAVLPQVKSSPSIAKNALTGAVLLTLILMAVYVAQMLMDDTVKSADEVEKAFGVMPLTVIPEGDLASIGDRVEHVSNKRKRPVKSRKQTEENKN